MPVSRRLVLAGAAAAVVVGVGAVGASAALAGDEVPKGVRVEGIDLSGLSAAQAQAKLEDGLRARTTAPVAVVVDGEDRTLDPAASGLDVDTAATARQATTASVVTRLRATFGAGRDLDPVVAVDDAALRASVRRLAGQVDRRPREGAVRFEGVTPVPVQPVTGRALDVDGSAEQVRENWLEQDRIELPAELTRVRTTEQDVARAVREIAAPAVAAPVTLVAGKDELAVPPAAIAAALSISADGSGRLVPRLDPAVLHAKVRPGLAAVGQRPVDARFDVSSGRPVVVPSRAGSTVAAKDLGAAVGGVLTDEPPRRVPVALTPAQPRLTTAKAQGLGVREVIGSFTTRHPCCRGRVQNIHRIADIVDGAVVLPGERFDLNAFVGPRDRARGFVEAPQILEGEFVDRVGGGVSQFATTLFNAVFFSGLEDITHSPHSYYITRYPPGREATVSYPLPDLIFKNDSPHGVLIKTSYTGTSITVTFWGTKRFDEVRSVTGPRVRLRPFETRYVDRPDCTATAGEPGFDITVTRVFVAGGKVVRREPFFTRYKPEPRFICGRDPAA